MAFKGARKHARQPQLFLINHPRNACQGSTCGLGGGGHPQADTTALHLQVKDAQSARVNRVIRIEPKNGIQMFRQSAAGCRHLLPAFRESFSVSRINFCRSSLARTCTVTGSERARGRRTSANGGCAHLQTRLAECALSLGCITRLRTVRARTYLDLGSSEWTWSP